MRLETRNATNGNRLDVTPTAKPSEHPVINDGRLYLTDGSRLRAYTVPRLGCCPAPR
jgi:hypothetical protein